MIETHQKRVTLGLYQAVEAVLARASVVEQYHTIVPSFDSDVEKVLTPLCDITARYGPGKVWLTIH